MKKTKEDIEEKIIDMFKNGVEIKNISRAMRDEVCDQTVRNIISRYQEEEKESEDDDNYPFCSAEARYRHMSVGDEMVFPREQFVWVAQIARSLNSVYFDESISEDRRKRWAVRMTEYGTILKRVQ